MLDQIERKLEDAITPRAAEVFEHLRLRTERHAAAGGSVPVFLLAEIGDLKMRKARSGFVANFFGCGGFPDRDRGLRGRRCGGGRSWRRKADAVVVVQLRRRVRRRWCRR